MRTGIQKANNQDQFVEGEKRFNTSKLMLEHQNTVREKPPRETTSQKCLKERWRMCD